MVTRQELKTAAIPRFGKSVHPALLHVCICCSRGIKNMAPIGSCVFSRRTTVLLALLPSIQDLMCSHMRSCLSAFFWWHVIGLNEDSLGLMVHLGKPAPCGVRKNSVKGILGPGLLPSLPPFWN